MAKIEQYGLQGAVTVVLDIFLTVAENCRILFFS